jgi:hypothetical protein
MGMRFALTNKLAQLLIFLFSVATTTSTSPYESTPAGINYIPTFLSNPEHRKHALELAGASQALQEPVNVPQEGLHWLPLQDVPLAGLQLSRPGSAVGSRATSRAPSNRPGIDAKVGSQALPIGIGGFGTQPHTANI